MDAIQRQCQHVNVRHSTYCTPRLQDKTERGLSGISGISVDRRSSEASFSAALGSWRGGLGGTGGL